MNFLNFVGIQNSVSLSNRVLLQVVESLVKKYLKQKNKYSYWKTGQEKYKINTVKITVACF